MFYRSPKSRKDVADVSKGIQGVFATITLPYKNNPRHRTTLLGKSNMSTLTKACLTAALPATEPTEAKKQSMPKGTPRHTPRALGTSSFQRAWTEKGPLALHTARGAVVTGDNVIIFPGVHFEAVVRGQFNSIPGCSLCGERGKFLWRAALLCFEAVAKPSSVPGRLLSQPWVTRPCWRAFRCSVARSVRYALPWRPPFAQRGEICRVESIAGSIALSLSPRLRPSTHPRPRRDGIARVHNVFTCKTRVSDPNCDCVPHSAAPSFA